MPQMQEFCIRLSMSKIEGRPLSVTLARFQEFNNPLIGCSREFLHMTGRPRNDLVGRNCRILNQGLDMPTSVRERLHHTIRTGAPFMGLLKNKRYLGNGCWDTFENALHIVVVFAGVKTYLLGIQVNVTGLNLNLTEGSSDAARLQLMFDSVLSSDPDSFIKAQERQFQLAPLYLHIRHAGDIKDEVWIVEGEPQGDKWPVQQVANQQHVLAPQFMPMRDVQGKPSTAKSASWADEPFKGCEVYADASYTVSRTPTPPTPPCERRLQYESGEVNDSWQAAAQALYQYKSNRGNDPGQATIEASYEYETGMGNDPGQPQVKASDEYKTGDGNDPGQAAVQASYEYKAGAGNDTGQAAVKARSEDATTEAPDDESFTRQTSPADSVSYSSKGCTSTSPADGAPINASLSPPSKYTSLSAASIQEHDQALKCVGTPTMKTQLRALDLEDPATVIIARGISKLGNSADETLKKYFDRFGAVKAVHIPHTFKKLKRSKHGADGDASARETRAPGRCFIVMSSPEERTRILAHATVHLVRNVKVSLEAFSAKPYMNLAAEADDTI